jgi:stage II sporulation protein GA (sporulation sigma-E factor processing peptidase)
MKIYLDLILLLNFGFDFILLLSVSLILRRNVKIYKILIGAFIGSISILTLFININSIELFIIKIIISILMCISSFDYKNLKYTAKNIIFLYISSIILGGALYLLNIEYSYKNQGIIFYKNKLSTNFIILLITAPIIIYIYIKECKTLKINYSNYHKIEIEIKDKKIKCIGFVDTGNKLKDPYKKRPIILMNNNYLQETYEQKILVPAHTISGTNLIQCIKIKKLKIDNKEIKKEILLGFIKKKIKIDGIDCLLNYEIMEE